MTSVLLLVLTKIIFRSLKKACQNNPNLRKSLDEDIETGVRFLKMQLGNSLNFTH